MCPEAALSHFHSAGLGQGQQLFITSWTPHSAAHHPFWLNGAGWVRASGLSTPSWKDLETEPVAFSTVCLCQLLCWGTEPNAAAGHSCPLSLWPVASHTPAGAASPRRPKFPVVEFPMLELGMMGIYCLAPSIQTTAAASLPSNVFITAEWEPVLFKTIFKLPVIQVYRKSHRATAVTFEIYN